MLIGKPEEKEATQKTKT